MGTLERPEALRATAWHGRLARGIMGKMLMPPKYSGTCNTRRVENPSGYIARSNTIDQEVPTAGKNGQRAQQSAGSRHWHERQFPKHGFAK